MNKGYVKTFQLISYFVLALVFIAVPTVMGNTGMVSFGPIEMPSASFKGILQVILTLCCISMVLIDVRRGTVIASILLGVYFVQMVIIIAVRHIFSAMPGAVNIILSLIMIGLISSSIKKIEKDSITDKATGLYNIKGFKEALENRITKKKHFYIMVIHLKNVSNVVCDLGYEYGEVLLKEIGNRLLELTQNKELVGKLDGHEFVMAIPESYDPQTFADRVIEAIGEKLVVKNQGVSIDCYIPAYIGVSEYIKDSTDIDELIRFAGVAMCHALDDGNDRTRVYREQLQVDLHRAAEIERIIKRALEEDSFRMVFQPQYEMDGKHLRGFEALLRLTLPDGTKVRPGEMIPVAENTNLILEVDDYVMHKAMTQFKPIIKKMTRPVVFSINVSAKNIARVGFADKVKHIVEQTGFPPENLEIEITEYSFADTTDNTTNNIIALKEMGAKIALDDFGTGYTSLSKLLNLSVDILKIDKSLVDDLESNKINQDFVDSIIYMGHLMDCEVIAEGVEKEGQLEILRERNCDLVQGYVWGRPMEFEDALALCEKERKGN